MEVSTVFPSDISTSSFTRLADYIGKVEFYKTENARLNRDLGELEKKYKELNEKLTKKYDAELDQLRTDLKDERVEKEALRVKVYHKAHVQAILKSSFHASKMGVSIRLSVQRSGPPVASCIGLVLCLHT